MRDTRTIIHNHLKHNHNNNNIPLTLNTLSLYNNRPNILPPSTPIQINTPLLRCKISTHCLRKTSTLHDQRINTLFPSLQCRNRTRALGRQRCIHPLQAAAVVLHISIYRVHTHRNNLAFVHSSQRRLSAGGCANAEAAGV